MVKQLRFDIKISDEALMEKIKDEVIKAIESKNGFIMGCGTDDMSDYYEELEVETTEGAKIEEEIIELAKECLRVVITTDGKIQGSNASSSILFVGGGKRYVLNSKDVLQGKGTNSQTLKEVVRVVLKDRGIL